MRKKRLILIAAVALIVLIAGAVGVFYFQKQKEAAEHEALLQSIAQGADDVVDAVNSALKANAPTTWVYDRDNNLMFTIKLTDAIQSISTLPSILADKVSQSATLTPEQLIVQEFLKEKGVGLGGDTEAGYIRRVQSDISRDDALRYLAITSTYGGIYVGATDAANNYFGKTLDLLNDSQLTFIAEAYRNDTLNVEQYLEEHSLSREKLGLIDIGFDSAAIRSHVLSELEALPVLKLRERSYNVKLTLSTSQQASLQSVLDTGTRQLIDLNADGTYAMDASVVVVDGNTGFIRAMLPCRSSSKPAATVFKLNGLGFIDNTLALLATLEKDNVTGNSLVAVQKDNGDIEYHSVSELYENLTLSSKSTNKSVGAVDVVNLLFSQEEDYLGISMISEVKEVGGNTVYAAKGSTGLQKLNSKVCEFFDCNQGQIMFGTDYSLSTGIVSFQKTADYVVAFVGGTGAVGGSSTSAERDLLLKTSENIRSLVASLYPTPTSKIWAPTPGEVVAYVYEENFKLVGMPIFDGVTALLDLPINSRETRQDWEAIYSQFQKLIADNTKYFGEVRAAQLNERLESARNARSQELLKYSV